VKQRALAYITSAIVAAIVIAAIWYLRAHPNTLVH